MGHGKRVSDEENFCIIKFADFDLSHGSIVSHSPPI
jgi:hypothetical protein